MKIKVFVFILFSICYLSVVAQCNSDIKTGQATFYKGIAGSAKGNCSLPVGINDTMHGALNTKDYDGSMACGACIEIKGPQGKAIVKIVDRCPGCKPGDIDITKEAFAKIGNINSGRVPVTWQFIPCKLSSGATIKVNFKAGSSKYWTGIQIRDAKEVVKTLAYFKGNSWIPIKRKMYNYFVATEGIHPPMKLKITSISGKTLILEDLLINDKKDIDTQRQF